MSFFCFVPKDGKQIVPEPFHDSLGTLQQKVGEGLRQCLSVNVWIDILFHQIQDEDRVLITDVRYRNEADRIKSEGGLLIRINGDPNNDRSKDKRADDHRSETDLDDYAGFDITIENDQGIESLEKKAQWIAELVK